MMDTETELNELIMFGERVRVCVPCDANPNPKS